MGFFEIHAHTEYSNIRLLDSINKTKELLKTADKMGLMGLAITDHECLSSHVIANSYKSNREDFKVALGNEIYLVDNYDSTKFYHFILIAKNKVGYQQIRELSSKAWKNSFYKNGMERVVTLKQDLFEIIGENKGNIIMSTACLGGELPKLILNSESTDEFINSFKWLAGDDFYLELQVAKSEEQSKVNRELINLSKKHNIKYIFSNDAHYLNAEHRNIHKAFLNAKDGDREVDSFYEYTYLKTEDEIYEVLESELSKEEIREGISNTIDIYNKIEKYSILQGTIIPEIKYEQHDLRKTIYEKGYEYIDKFYNSDSLQNKQLIYLIENGLTELKQEINEDNLSRIDIELKQLWLISEKLKQNISSYYNLLVYIVDILWKEEQGNSLVGAGRGSACGYYICYLLKITQINPIKFNLPFWRHLSIERPELPKHIMGISCKPC